MLRRSFWAAPAALGLAWAGSALAKPKHKGRPEETAPPPPPPPPSPAAALFGAWLLVSAETLIEGETPAPAFGFTASGMLIYDQSGEMSLQIAGDRPSVGDIELYQAMRPSERMVFLDNYYAYFGSFEVDTAGHTVIHRVKASLRPNETGITYRRKFMIEGPRLTLASPPETHGGQSVSSRMIFVRA